MNQQNDMSARFARVAAGHVVDALEHLGVFSTVLPNRIRPITPATRFAGPALTLRLALSRTGKESRRLDDVVEGSHVAGSVVVIDAGGQTSAALFGGRAGFAAKRSGAVGVVIDGASRDIDELAELGLPIHAFGRALAPSEGKFEGVELNGVSIIDGVLIRPGDWLMGDDSGICVIPKGMELEVLRLAEERDAIDKESMEELKAGKTLAEAHRHFHDDDHDELQRLS